MLLEVSTWQKQNAITYYLPWWHVDWNWNEHLSLQHLTSSLWLPLLWKFCLANLTCYILSTAHFPHRTDTLLHIQTLEAVHVDFHLDIGICDWLTNRLCKKSNWVSANLSRKSWVFHKNLLILDGQLLSNNRQNKHLFVLFRFKLLGTMYLIYDSYSIPYQLQYI